MRQLRSKCQLAVRLSAIGLQFAFDGAGELRVPDRMSDGNGGGSPVERCERSLSANRRRVRRLKGARDVKERTLGYRVD
jgi:hypothetical protein